MHSSITPARIPPDITIVPADIRPALHQTLQGETGRDESRRERWKFNDREEWGGKKKMSLLDIWILVVLQTKIKFTAKYSAYLRPTKVSIMPAKITNVG